MSRAQSQLYLRAFSLARLLGCRFLLRCLAGTGGGSAGSGLAGVAAIGSAVSPPPSRTNSIIVVQRPPIGPGGAEFVWIFSSVSSSLMACVLTAALVLLENTGSLCCVRPERRMSLLMG